MGRVTRYIGSAFALILSSLVWAESGNTPDLDFTPASYNFGTKTVGTTTDFTIRVRNNGNVRAEEVRASGLSAPITFRGGSYPGTGGGDCDDRINKNNNCDLVVRFAPTAAGTFSRTLILTYENPSGTTFTSSITITGQAQSAASLSISDGPTYDFGTRVVNSNTDKVFTVTNSGGTNATSVSASSLGFGFSFRGGSFPGTGGDCGSTIGAGSSCTVVVRFTPFWNISPFSSSVQLNYQTGAGSASASRAIRGEGGSAASLSISDGATYSFGSKVVGTSTDKTFTVSNSGYVDAESLTASNLSGAFTFKGGSFPGVGGTCGSTLNGDSSCTLVVTFAPSSAGSQSAQISLSYFNGSSNQTATRNLSGTAIAAALLTISDSPSFSYGTKIVGTNTDKTFTVTNSGGTSATSLAAGALAAGFSFKGGSFPGTGGTCGTSLGVSASCSFVVTFSPASSGAFNATVTLDYHNGASVQSTMRALSGTGLALAALSLSETSYAFGELLVGGNASRSFTVSNTGQSAANSVTLTSPSGAFRFAGGAYPGTGGNCSTSLPAGANCNLILEFAPVASGAFSQSLTLSYDDGSVTRTLNLSLSGSAKTVANLVSADAPAYSFGTLTVGTSADHSVTFTNNGETVATGLTLGALNSPFSVVSQTCGASLAVGASCQAVVRYQPMAAGGLNHNWSIGYSDGITSRNLMIALSGTGRSVASLQADSSSHDFGSLLLGLTADHTFTFTNTGDTAASALTFAGLSSNFTRTGGTCASDLSPLASCTLTVRFTPTAAGGLQQIVSVSYFDGAYSAGNSITLNGQGRNPALLTISDSPSYSFGTLEAGGAVSHVFTISNSGDATATSLSLTNPAAPFVFSANACGSDIASASSCQVTLRFDAQTVGTSAVNWTFSYFDGVNVKSVTLGLSGTTLAPALLAFTESGFNFGAVVVGKTQSHVFTLTNQGASTAQLGAATASTPFSWSGGDCGASLPAGGTCTLNLAFAPTSSGAVNATPSLNYQNGLANTSVSLSVQGTGRTKAVLSWTAGTYSFGTVAPGTPVTQGFSVTNTGESDAVHVSVGSLSSPYSIVSSDCGTTLAAGQSCLTNVAFQPSTAGTFAAVLNLSYDDSFQINTIHLNLTGTGAQPALILISDAPSYSFGARALGSQTSHSFVVSNSGGMAATALVSSGVSGYFSIQNQTCASTLAASSACLITVTFSPASLGSASSQLLVNYFDGISSQSFSVALTGSGVPSGELDPTFDGDGRVATGASLADTIGEAVAVQPDGKIVMAGHHLSGTRYRVALVRYLADGTVDSGFGSGGLVTTGIGTIDDRAYAVAVQADGKILAAGYSATSLGKDFLIVRYNANGTLDTTYNSGRGWSRNDIAFGDDIIRALILQPNGMAVVAGSSFVDTDEDFIVARYTTAGKFDSPFNGAGMVSFDFGFGNDGATSLALQADGKIVVAGSATNEFGGRDMAVFRLNASGSYDTSFAGAEGVTFRLGEGDSGARGTAITSGGEIIVGGSAIIGGAYRFAVTRLFGNGTIDTSFGTQGLTTVDFGSENHLMALALQTDGKIVTAGYSAQGTSGHRFALARLTAQGNLDSYFGSAGLVQTAIGSNTDDRIQGLAFQPDGKIVVGGYTYDGTRAQFAGARYTP